MMQYNAEVQLVMLGLSHGQLSKAPKAVYGRRLHLHREPDNKKDKCAVVVTDLAYRYVGYLPSPLAPMVFSMLNRGIPVTCDVVQASSTSVKITAVYPEEMHPVLLAEATHRDQNSGYTKVRARVAGAAPSVASLLDEWDDEE